MRYRCSELANGPEFGCLDELLLDALHFADLVLDPSEKGLVLDRNVDLNAPSAFDRTAPGQVRTVAAANGSTAARS